MAVECGGFSIREYALKMRTVDVAKCWPFDGDSDEIRKEDVEASLPPITVKKFRWWSDELDLVRSNEERGKIDGESSTSSFSEAISKPEKMEVALELSKAVLASEGEKLDVGCPVCRVFTAATANAMMSHVDGCVAQASKGEQKQEKKVKAKSKSRTPKKRSIVEIFSVAPQVETVGVDDDYEEEEEEEDCVQDTEVRNSKVMSSFDVGLKAKNKEKMKKKKGKSKDETTNKLKKRKKMSKIKKTTPKNRRDRFDRLVQSIIKKEKPQKPKMQSPTDFTTKPNSLSYDEVSGKDISDDVSIKRKKPSIKCLATQKKNKVSKLIKHQKSVIPVRGILKNRKKAISQKISTVYSLQCASQVNQYGMQQADRRVRFSDRDDILGPKRKLFPSVDLPKLQNVCSLNSSPVPASSVKDHAIERTKHLAIEEVNESDGDISISTETETDAQPVSEKLLSDTCRLNIPNFLRPRTGFSEHLFDRPATVNRLSILSENSHTYEQGKSDASHEPVYGQSPRLLPLLKESHNRNVNIPLDAGFLRSSGTSDRLIEYQSGYRTTAALMGSLGHVKAFPQPSSSCFALNRSADGSLQYPSQNTTLNHTSHALQNQPFYHLSPKELIRNICSFPDWKQRAITSAGKCVNEDLYGLPLNSQGELIQFNSCGNAVFNQLVRPTSTMTGSSRSQHLHNMLRSSTMDIPNFKGKNYDGRTATVDQLKVLPAQSYANKNPNVPISSRLGISRSQGNGNSDVHCLGSLLENNHPVYHLNSDMELMSIPGHGQRQYNQVQGQFEHGKGYQQDSHDLGDHVPIHATQPTMRLMGKEFTVGRRSNDLQEFEDGKIWTDKQIIAEHRPANTPIDSSSLQKQIQQPASGKLKENAAWSSEPRVNQSSQSELQMKPPGSSFSHHPYINFKTDSGYPDHYSTIPGNCSPKLHPCSSSPAYHSSFCQTPLLQESFVFGYEPLKINSQIPKWASAHGNMSSDFAELQNKQRLPHATKSVFKFPFLPPHCGEHSQPSRRQSLPPWLISATQQKETPKGSYPSYSDGGRYSSCTISGSSLRTIHSMQRPPDFPDPCNLVSTVPNLTNLASFGYTTLDSAPTTDCRGLIHTSGGNKNRCGRTMLEKRLSQRVAVKEPDQCKKTRKRPATKSADFAKPAKMPHLTVQEDSIPETVVLSASMAALELQSIRDEASIAKCGSDETQIDEIGVSTVTDTSKLGGNARPGPLKLSAGVKHILKPLPNLNARPSHSAVSLSAATGSGQTSESEKKSSQIYRF